MLEAAGLKPQPAHDRFPHPWVRVNKLAWLLRQKEKACTEYAWAEKFIAHMYRGGYHNGQGEV